MAALMWRDGVYKLADCALGILHGLAFMQQNQMSLWRLTAVCNVAHITLNSWCDAPYTMHPHRMTVIEAAVVCICLIHTNSICTYCKHVHGCNDACVPIFKLGDDCMRSWRKTKLVKTCCPSKQQTAHFLHQRLET